MENVFIIALILIIVIISIDNRIRVKKKYNKVTNSDSINEESYQKYAKFYEHSIPADILFEKKMNIIYQAIMVDKKKDIKKIAAKAGCSYDECILKIRYLKNKRRIGDLHIDHINGLLLPCTPEDSELLTKYKPFIYHNHLTISEMAARMPGASFKTLDKYKEKVFNDLKNLYDKDLINGVKLNEVDKEILYYTVEKNKKEKDFISIRCKNCGAINDVNRGNKTRCEYCNTIIEDKTVE